MISHRAVNWRITVTMGMGSDARVEVFDPAGVRQASARWLPSPAIALGWGVARMNELAEMPASERPQPPPTPGVGTV